MRISQKLEYACRAMACLAKHYDGSSVVKVEEIADQEAIPSSFLVQILNELKRSDLVASKRGKAGGYTLTRNPGAINLAEVTKAIEPGLLETPVQGQGQYGPGVHQAWLEVSKNLEESLAATTLEAIAASSESPMYFI